MKPPALPRRYSGPESVVFWNRIHKVRNERDRDRLHSLGLALQNLEGDVLRLLEEAANESLGPEKRKGPA